MITYTCECCGEAYFTTTNPSQMPRLGETAHAYAVDVEFRIHTGNQPRQFCKRCEIAVYRKALETIELNNRRERGYNV